MGWEISYGYDVPYQPYTLPAPPSPSDGPSGYLGTLVQLYVNFMLP